MNLHEACHTGAIEDVHRLLTAHPELLNHPRIADGCTPLHVAALAGRVNIVDDLLNRGASVDVCDRAGYAPIHYAASAGAAGVVRRLITSGADLHAVNDSLTTVLHMAAAGGSIELIQEMLGYGIAPDIPNLYGETPLHRAAQANQSEAVQLLIERGAAIDAADRYAMTPVQKAAIGGAVEVLGQLCDRGARLDVADLLDDSPLHAAAGMARVDAARWLLDHGVDINVQNAEHATALHAAAKRGPTELLTLLLERGADPNATDALGRSPLHIAAAEGQAALLAPLVQHGADPNLPDHAGHTPADVAAIYGHRAARQAMTALAGTARIVPEAVRGWIDRAPQGEATLWYLGHSGWAIRTANHFLVIDYAPDGPDEDEASLLNGRIVAAELPDLPTTVLVTHHHADHFSPRILEWQADRDIRYVFGWNADVDAPAHRFAAAGDLSLDDLKITAIPSTDSGVAFLIEADRLRIYHAGDHAAMQPPPEPNFAKGMSRLGDRFAPIDLAFLPVFGCGLPNIESLRAGNDLTLNRLLPRIVAPMHVGWTGHFYREEKRRLESMRSNVCVIAASHPGDRYSIRNGHAAPFAP